MSCSLGVDKHDGVFSGIPFVLELLQRSLILGISDGWSTGVDGSETCKIGLEPIGHEDASSHSFDNFSKCFKLCIVYSLPYLSPGAVLKIGETVGKLPTLG